VTSRQLRPSAGEGVVVGVFVIVFDFVIMGFDFVLTIVRHAATTRRTSMGPS
jgi:hypothetical protein